MPVFLRPALILAFVLLTACTERSTPEASIPTESVSALESLQLTGTIPYALAAPDARWQMPSVLNEISGLSLMPNGNIAAIQDEDGDVFEISSASGEVLNHRRFYNSGDYEGVEVVGDVTWVVESDGDLYRYTGSGEAERFETGLKRANDVEGLAYDARGNRLLLACKGNPGKGLKGVRTIYAYDLANGTLGDEPVFTLDREAIDAGGAPFKPSGLAIHPASGEIYIVSSVRKALIVLTPEGDLSAAVSLPSGLYPQAEGIAFDADGTLYISNEGGSGTATLLRFSLQPLP